MGIVGILLVLAGVYTLSTMGRRHHPGLNALRGHLYAHRGLHSPGCPENSMAAFRAALEQGYGVELDVHLLSDGSLGVMHDSDLRRTTGRSGKMEELTAKSLSDYRLEGTEEQIPLLCDVLALFQGKAPLIIELKTANNAPQLCEAVCKALEGYHGAYCLESFDPRCLVWLKKHRADLIRGQLAENCLGYSGNVPFFLRLAMTIQCGNFLTMPDFVAYRYCDRKNLGNFLARRVWGLTGVSWTIRTPEELAQAQKEGWIPIFEGFQP